MALLELGGKKFTIPPGTVALGSDAGCAIQVGGADVLPRHALFEGTPDGQVVIRKAVPEAEVLINGVRLGAEPTPLLHGDKVQVGPNELTFVDERRSGSTQYVEAVNLPQMMAQAAKGKGGKTGNTGGRVVSLTDGREYAVAGASLVFGREATCDVVVTGKDISRRHAEIMVTPKGYAIVDSSTNGTWVNDERVQGQRVLARGDVIKLGEDSFRFYADVTPAAPSPPPPGPAASQPPAAPQPSPVPSVGSSGERLKNTSFGMPATPPPAGRASQAGPLANMLVRSGALKGQRIQLRTPVVNIGRADYNDAVLPDESVSTSHAKLQRREGVWILTDLESTNGTFVDGERVQGDAPLAPGAMVRFGDVQLVFEPTDDAMGVAKGGGTKMIEAFKAPAPAPKPAAPAPAPAPKAAPPAAAASPAKAAPKRPVPPPVAEKKGKGCGASAAMVVLGCVAAAYWILT
ncbi:MAG TPA: FHA domain-containing protein [Gemmatimonadales bacterium]|nr:FHA domain-containing protein [Gemmatimonadales bacterium]